MGDQMRLYQGCSAATAREVLDHGFIGELWMPLKEGHNGGIVRDNTGKPAMMGEEPERWCVFRSGSFGAGSGEEEESQLVVIPEGNLVLMIEVPEDFAERYEVVERPDRADDTGAASTDREFWLPQEIADTFRDTMKVYDRDGAEIPRDLVGKSSGSRFSGRSKQNFQNSVPSSARRPSSE
jgi:hypothetical protein